MSNIPACPGCSSPVGHATSETPWDEDWFGTAVVEPGDVGPAFILYAQLDPTRLARRKGVALKLDLDTDVVALLDADAREVGRSCRVRKG